MLCKTVLVHYIPGPFTRVCYWCTLARERVTILAKTQDTMTNRRERPLGFNLLQLVMCRIQLTRDQGMLYKTVLVHTGTIYSRVVLV
jgi:hypothetical protein